MNPFKIGDRIRSIDGWFSGNYLPNEEYIVTCVDDIFIGFVSKYPEDKRRRFLKIRKGKYANWIFRDFELIESVDDMSFNKQMKEIVK